jgi:L-cysteate sulfo-lyase
MSRSGWERVPRVKLAHLPAPLEPAPRLGEAVGLRRLWVKRDDLTGLGAGGNKARKLEYLMAEAQALGATTVITVGAVQSNHACMTAAAAARLGMSAVLVLSGAEPDEARGNLLLDRLLGARVLFVPEGDQARQAVANAEAERLRARGERPYVIPTGGSTPLGCLGYTLAMRELAQQSEALGIRFRRLFVASGSGGTQAGLHLGARAFLPDLQVVGVAVGEAVEWLRGEVLACAAGAAEAFGIAPAPTAGEITLLGEYAAPGYGVPGPAAREAMRLAARTEGLFVDPVYTAKALAGLIDHARAGRLDPDEPVLFWHTGGLPGLFADPALCLEEP